MTTALTAYLTETADTTLTTADTLLENASTGAGLSNKNSNLTSSTTGWVEIYSQGNGTAQTGAGSEPAPSGHGWIDPNTTLQTNHFIAGTWSFTLLLNNSGTSGTFTADVHFRAYQRSSTGTYTLIGEAVLSGQSIVVDSTNTSYTTVNASVSASASNTFQTGDRLYIDCLLNITTNTTSGNIRMKASNSSTVGSTSAQVVTPGYVAVTTSTRTIPSAAALLQTSSRIIPSVTALLQTSSRIISNTVALLWTQSRSIPATVALGASRNIPTTIALLQTSSRIISNAVALLWTQSRVIPLAAALLQTSVRNIPTILSLLASSSRIVPLAAALLQTSIRNIPALAAFAFTSTRIVSTSVSLYLPAVFYATSVVSSLGGLTLSDQMAQMSGGAETSVSVTMPASGTGTYVELLSQGGSSGATNALPAPTGKGWSVSLSGYTILAGAWSGMFTLAKSGTSIAGGSLVVRWYRRTVDGVYYPIGAVTLNGQTFSTAKTTYILPSVNSSYPWQFIGGDTLYMDAFVLNPGHAWASDVFTVYVSSSSTLGVYNDGTTIAPELIATPPGLSCLIGATNFETGQTLSVLNESFTLADALDQRSILTLTGEDPAGNLTFTHGMPVILSEHDQGVLYTGYVNSDKVTKIAAGGVAQTEHQLTFMDNHYAADKRANETNYLNWAAGDIICDFIQQILSQEGVIGDFALESDYTQTTLAQGTLNNTVATTTTSPFTYAPNTATPPITSNTGDLELVREGTQFMLTESVTADFSSGTLNNMVASGNKLSPTTQQALKVTAWYSPVATASSALAQESGGTQSSGEGIVNEAIIFIYNTSFTIGTNDTFNYDIWISSSSPAFLAGIDFACTDGTYLSGQNGTLDSSGNVGLFDSNGVSVDLLQDLSGYAKDTWYTRSIPLTGLNGKTILFAYVYFTGSVSGNYTVFLKNCYFSSQPTNYILSPTMTTIPLGWPAVQATGGYVAATVIPSVVSVYNPLTSYRVSPAHSISSVGLVQNSTITWTASLPTTGGPVPVYPPGTTSSPSSNLTVSSSSASTGAGTITSSSAAMVLMVSYDGSTWLLCQNNEALPGLPPGAVVSGYSFYLREQFASGPDPTAIPSLEQVQITINSAAAQSVTDSWLFFGTTTEWNTGTQVLTGPNANGNLTLGSSANPLTQSWSGGIPGNQTFLAGWNNDGTQGTSGSAYTMTPGSNAGTWCQSRFDFAGYFLNGTIEADVKISSTSSNTQCGIEYRQTGWSNANNNGAYYVAILSGQVQFGYGQNSDSNTDGTFTAIIAISETINANTYYHLKIVVQGNRHTIYFNHGSSPIIDLIDNQYPNAGEIGFRAYSGTGSFTASIENFSLVTTTVGTWTSQNYSLPSGMGSTCGYTQVCWTDLDSQGQPETAAIVLASINGGATWQQCTNGAEIPQLPRGTNITTATIMFKIILYSATPPISTPVIMGLYMRICGNYGTVSGTRISPALSLTPVGYIANSNIMWNGNTPTSTSIAVATSQDGATWTAAGGGGAGAVLPYWTNQPSATQDLFSSNTSSNYTSTYKTGGSAASVTYYVPNNSLTLVGGSGALYLNNTLSCADIDLLCDMDWSDAGGLVWHETDTGDYYEIGVYDASSSSGYANQINLYRVTSGTRSLLGSAPITFTRGTFHRARTSMKGGLIDVYFDGKCVLSYLDILPLTSGSCGLRNDGGTSRYYQFWAQPLGTNLSGQTLYTQVTLSTSDPAQMPQLFTLVACVRGSSIGTGATIQQLHPVTLPFAAYHSAEMDNLIQVSGDWYWYIDRYKKMHFALRMARQGAFPIQSVEDPAKAAGYLLYVPQVTIQSSADVYRNQQVVTNVTGLVNPPPEIKTADGSTTSWTLGYPVYSAPTITINGNPATVGIQGIDNNKQFYWQPTSSSISYDSTLPVLPAGTILSITYVGQSTVNVIINNSVAQSAQGALELNSGIIAEIESADTYSTSVTSLNGMTTAQATTFANGLLARYGNNGTIELIGTTLYPGLVPGTVIPLFIPEIMEIWNAQVPIVKLTTTAFNSENGIRYYYSVDASSGPNLTQWQRVWF